MTGTSTAWPGRVGPKETVTGKRAVASSQHRIVTETMLDTMRAGGNAVDAAIAGSLVQAVVQQDMTNHTGTVTALVHDANWACSPTRCPSTTTTWAPTKWPGAPRTAA